MKKLVLLTGGSKGIGLAIADNLKENYNVVTVSRGSTSTEQGDLLDPTFRNYLVEKYTPDIFINNAASLYKDPQRMLEMNGLVPVDLLLKFYEKMDNGIIINMGSQSSEKQIRPKDDLATNVYSLGKRFLKDVSLSLNYSKNKPIKVMCLSPAATHTPILSYITNFEPKAEDYTNYDWNSSIAWTKPEEIAGIVRYLIELPEYICISELVVDNHYSNAVYW
jgi:NADP-dependent 3-hydroxy acid dehydrogenase YdfG